MCCFIVFIFSWLHFLHSKWYELSKYDSDMNFSCKINQLEEKYYANNSTSFLTKIHGNGVKMMKWFKTESRVKRIWDSNPVSTCIRCGVAYIFFQWFTFTDGRMGTGVPAHGLLPGATERSLSSCNQSEWSASVSCSFISSGSTDIALTEEWWQILSSRIKDDKI